MPAPLLPPPRPAPDVLDDEFAVLLDPALGTGPGGVPQARGGILRQRVVDRIGRSARASRAFVTVRQKDTLAEQPAPGVQYRTLYQASGHRLRPGEPRGVHIVELAAGARWQLAAATAGVQREWLLMQGDASIGDSPLCPHDYHVVPAGEPSQALASDGGARLYLREALLPDAAGPAYTVPEAGAVWVDFAPGIRRRLLWSSGPQAAMLYHALPGATVPRHGHGHDEECLMLEGELFLDEVLLRPGEYQLAPAGSVHEAVSTDTGVLLYAHGDLDLELLPA